MKSEPLTGRSLSYSSVGATQPGERDWNEAPTPLRRFEATVKVSDDPSDFDRLSNELMNWAIKTRRGFEVRPEDGSRRAAAQCDYWLIAAFGFISIKEPARVVEVVNQNDRRGFAYGTLTGHPVSGEEAFVVARKDDGVYLNLRSLTSPGSGLWKQLWPFVFVAQKMYRRRYQRALMQRPQTW